MRFGKLRGSSCTSEIALSQSRKSHLPNHFEQCHERPSSKEVPNDLGNGALISGLIESSFLSLALSFLFTDDSSFHKKLYLLGPLVRIMPKLCRPFPTSFPKQTNNLISRRRRGREKTKKRHYKSGEMVKERMLP